jgi:hypothetical protein
LLQQSPGVDGQPRYSLFETVREYAQERLAACGEREAARAWHAAYYLALIEAAEVQFTGHEQCLWLDRLATERDNLRAALGWCLAAGKADAGLRVAVSLTWLSYLRGHVAEGCAWLAQLLDRPEAAERTVVRATALTWAGVLAGLNDDHELARRWAEEGLAIAGETGDPAALALAELWLGNRTARSGEDMVAAEGLFRRSLARFQRLNDHWGSAEALCRLADLANCQGNYAAASAIALQASAAAHQAGDLRTTSYAKQQAGVAAGGRGEYAEALELLQASIALSERLGDRSGVSIAVRYLGRLALKADDVAAAAMWYRTSLERTRDGALGSERIISALEGLAAAAVLSRPDRTVLLAAACARLRQTLALPQAGEEWTALRRSEESARPMLTASEVDALRAAGGKMSLEEAIAYGMDGDR